jgi:hypothetical protein
MRTFNPIRQYKCTKFSTMNPDILKELFWDYMEKCAQKYHINAKKIYTVNRMTMNGVTVSNLQPIIANNRYEFVAKLRAKFREVTNMELYSHELIMDVIDDYVEQETIFPQPDLNISLENIIDSYIDDFEDGSFQYDMKLKIELYDHDDADDETDSDTDAESVISEIPRPIDDTDSESDEEEENELNRGGIWQRIRLEPLFDELVVIN